MSNLTEYRDELRTVKTSVLQTCRDLVRDLNDQDLPLEAMHVDEAQLYLRAAFVALDRTLVALVGKGPR